MFSLFSPNSKWSLLLVLVHLECTCDADYDLKFWLNFGAPNIKMCFHTSKCILMMEMDFANYHMTFFNAGR